MLDHLVTWIIMKVLQCILSFSHSIEVWVKQVSSSGEHLSLSRVASTRVRERESTIKLVLSFLSGKNWPIMKQHSTLIFSNHPPPPPPSPPPPRPRPPPRKLYASCNHQDICTLHPPHRHLCSPASSSLPSSSSPSALSEVACSARHTCNIRQAVSRGPSHWPNVPSMSSATSSWQWPSSAVSTPHFHPKSRVFTLLSVILLQVLLLASVPSVDSSWDQWWTYDGISGQCEFFLPCDTRKEKTFVPRVSLPLLETILGASALPCLDKRVMLNFIGPVSLEETVKATKSIVLYFWYFLFTLYSLASRSCFWARKKHPAVLSAKVNCCECRCWAAMDAPWHLH